MARCARYDDWENGQPTDTNPSYGGMHFEEGKGWCNSSGEQIRLNSEPWSSSPKRLSHETGNPNIPHGYRRVAVGVPCPINGSDDGVCYYMVNGKRALWDDGTVYMADE